MFRRRLRYATMDAREKRSETRLDEPQSRRGGDETCLSARVLSEGMSNPRRHAPRGCWDVVSIDLGGARKRSGASST